MKQRIFKGDKWNRLIGQRIPDGTIVNVVRFFPRRRVIVEYEGEYILTMLWCLKKITTEPVNKGLPANIGSCAYCGRFSHYHRVRWESNSNVGTYAIISWTCSKCGYCEEET